MPAKKKASAAAKKARRKGLHKKPSGIGTLFLGEKDVKNRRAHAEAREIGKEMEKVRRAGGNPVSVSKPGGFIRGPQSTVTDKNTGRASFNKRPKQPSAKRPARKKR